MGYHKDRMIQEEEQGWRFSDNNICSRCVSDPDLKQFIRETAALSPCDFCGWRGPHSVTFDSLMEIIGGTINQHYNDAVNEASWDSEDGYFGDTFDTFELFYRIGDPSNREAVNDAIRESLGIDRHWCQRHMYSLTGADRYIASWDDFCTTVKHKTRYFFDSTANDDDMGETIPVPRMLDELRDIVREASLIGTLPAGTMLFRVRPHGKAEVCNTWDTLGSPPDEVAVRMQIRECCPAQCGPRQVHSRFSI
jgi:hypothetical protein